MQGLIRSEPRYDEDITSSEFYKKWSQPGMVLPDAEAKRQEFVKRHLEAVKKCNGDDLRRVYELDYNKVMKVQKPKNKNNHQRFSQKRDFEGKLGKNKKYRRF